MNFIQQFFGKKEPNQEDVKEFIQRKIEENLNLDYKRFGAIDNSSKLAIHISSFANADGGLILLGIDQDEITENGKIIKIFPKEITWGSSSYSKETLEQKLLHRIKLGIPELTIVPIRNENKEVIFLIDIPKSSLAPHMGPDYRYHKRVNFGSQLMEHYEVQNLFRINWTMKEKLVEKIYEPLSIELGQYLKQLRGSTFYLPPYELNKVLSNTYYTRQMPLELSKQIDQLIQNIEDLNGQLTYTRITLKKILLKNIFEHLGLSQPKDYESIDLRFRLISDESQGGINIFDLFNLLLTNQTIKSYVNKHYQNRYSEITIVYQQKYPINLEMFNDIIWKQCLKEVALASKINQMKKDRTSLVDEIENLIDTIIEY